MTPSLVRPGSSGVGPVIPLGPGLATWAGCFALPPARLPADVGKGNPTPFWSVVTDLQLLSVLPFGPKIPVRWDLRALKKS